MYKVLIVDDIPEYVEMLKEYVEMIKAKFPDEKFLCIEAFNYNEAVEKLKKEEFSLAIIDVRLDEKDEENKEGLKLLSWIKENKPEVKVIMISAYKEFEFRIESLSKGAEFFLEKPLDFEILSEAIKKCKETKK